ncbi:hypothetical protein BT69DRAFT_1277161 [Atractiella rhizophila]|nr:hypothetical protein BT69DRAFT_1277161 [Atractiella rhizophila]
MALPESLYALSQSRASSPSTSKNASARSSPHISTASATSVLHSLDPILSSYSKLYNQLSSTRSSPDSSPKAAHRALKRAKGKEKGKGKERDVGNTSSFAKRGTWCVGRGWDRGKVEVRRPCCSAQRELCQVPQAAPTIVTPIEPSVQASEPLPRRPSPTPTPKRQERTSVHELLVERKVPDRKPGLQSTLEGMVSEFQNSISSSPYSFGGGGEREGRVGKKEKARGSKRSRSPLKLPRETIKRSHSPIPPSHPRTSRDDAQLQARRGSSMEVQKEPCVEAKQDSAKSLRLYFRFSLIPSTLILCFSLTLLVYRFSTLPTSPLPPSFLAFCSLFVFLISIVRLTPDSYLMVPFTDERGYRSAKLADDGSMFSFAMPILLAGGCYWDTFRDRTPPLPGLSTLPEIWLAQGFASTTQDHVHFSLTLAFQISLASFFLLPSVISRSNTRRWFGANTLSIGISALVGALLWAMGEHTWRLFHVRPWEAALSSFVYQSSHYMISRLARRGFTLGELSIVSGTGNALFIEFIRLSISRWYFPRGHPHIPSLFRNPTALVSFQHMLIPGSFFIGFCLAPMLIMSRHLGQQRSYRLKSTPSERERMRKLFAAGVYLGLVLIVFLVLGLWEGWILGRGISLLRPWAWVLKWVFLGSDGAERDGERGGIGWTRWKRIMLVYYWAAVVILAVGGWQSKFAKMKKMRRAGVGVNASTSKDGEGKDALERRGHVSLNLRRKFFHALAVALFAPGIVVDPAFTSLAFSLAFSIFTFAEYARYFALYPIGGAMHVFFAEFVDAKDAGPVIMSHFFLLTGCGGALWLEGNGIKQYTGLLVLGVGDALASIVGRKIGRLRWPGTSKTVEGTIAFVLSVHFVALLIRFFGLVEYFSATKYLLAVVLAGLLEATSNQNDNIVIPIYMWATLSLLDV